MKIHDLEHHINQSLSVEKITSDFYVRAEFCGMKSGSNIICSIDDENFEVPIGTPLEIIARVIQFNYFPTFVEIRVVAAVGGIIDEGKVYVPHAKYFFAKMYYNEDLELCSTDLEKFQ
ncbi:hypothetical protein [Massilia rubra]|uniref:PilZ domain-containing protein n=1 Tax=Massilia rubra TaxID=2607910 RepID=A0ABX0LI79_9BURK|nr:hypothetical protein [Massilia rubra]NHZ32145.1 hypothetical protein [Massilia rubra]